MTARSATLLLPLGVLLAAGGADAQDAPAAPPASKPARSPRRDAGPPLELGPGAMDLLKAASSRLAAARSMTFTAVVTYESPSRLGPPLAYTTRPEVLVERPDKLRVF